MRFLLLLSGGVAFLLAGLEVWRRRVAYWQGPNLRQQLNDWHASEPVIAPAQLPEVKVLKDTVKRRKLPKHEALKFKAGRR